jgi:hypothetical protein
MVDKAAELTRKGKEAWAPSVVERLLAEPVARKEELFPILIINRKGKHAVQPFGQSSTPFLVAVDENLGIGVRRAENMTARHELSPQLQVIIDLTVEDHRDRAILVPKRLVTTVDVDNGETTMTKMNMGRLVDKKAFTIGAPMYQSARHGTQVVKIALACETGQTAHGTYLLRLPSRS